MNEVREIVTRAVVAKGKKIFRVNERINPTNDAFSILGCWVINHNFEAELKEKKVDLKGNFEVNVWYAYDNNTKTNVIARTFTYEDIINVNLKQNITLTDDNEIIVRTLTAPSVSDVKTENNTIKLTVDKELGVEIVGDTKVRINVVDDFDDYDEEIDDNIEINEDYLNSVN